MIEPKLTADKAMEMLENGEADLVVCDLLLLKPHGSDSIYASHDGKSWMKLDDDSGADTYFEKWN